MQSKKHCNFLVHYQLLWQKCNLLVDNWLPYKLARYVYSSNSIAPIPIELTQHPTVCYKTPLHTMLTYDDLWTFVTKKVSLKKGPFSELHLSMAGSQSIWLPWKLWSSWVWLLLSCSLSGHCVTQTLLDVISPPYHQVQRNTNSGYLGKDNASQ